MPAIPIPYAQETMHGYEYALAGLMISEGMIDEGMEVVKAVRDRYRGFNRNPFNEIECGNNYARSMASFALLPIFSGFSFDMPKKEAGFSPVLSGDFRAPWFLDCAWGEYERKKSETKLTIFDGELQLQALNLPYMKVVTSVTADGKEAGFSFEEGKLITDISITKQLIIRGVNNDE